MSADLETGAGGTAQRAIVEPLLRAATLASEALRVLAVAYQLATDRLSGLALSVEPLEDGPINQPQHDP